MTSFFEAEVIAMVSVTTRKSPRRSARAGTAPGPGGPAATVRPLPIKKSDNIVQVSIKSILAVPIVKKVSEHKESPVVDIEAVSDISVRSEDNVSGQIQRLCRISVSEYRSSSVHCSQSEDSVSGQIQRLCRISVSSIGQVQSHCSQSEDSVSGQIQRLCRISVSEYRSSSVPLFPDKRVSVKFSPIVPRVRIVLVGRYRGCVGPSVCECPVKSWRPLAALPLFLGASCGDKPGNKTGARGIRRSEGNPRRSGGKFRSARRGAVRLVVAPSPCSRYRWQWCSRLCARISRRSRTM
ncbi:hypothetical protein J6590_035597 [Homalodisca vitripennis]|nr:hypothetical protein J6590_035597 [Homalodisca vitripennis]